MMHDHSRTITMCCAVLRILHIVTGRFISLLLQVEKASPFVVRLNYHTFEPQYSQPGQMPPHRYPNFLTHVLSHYFRGSAGGPYGHLATSISFLSEVSRTCERYSRSVEEWGQLRNSRSFANRVSSIPCLLVGFHLPRKHLISPPRRKGGGDKCPGTPPPALGAGRIPFSHVKIKNQNRN